MSLKYSTLTRIQTTTIYWCKNQPSQVITIFKTGSNNHIQHPSFKLYNLEKCHSHIQLYTRTNSVWRTDSWQAALTPFLCHFASSCYTKASYCAAWTNPFNTDSRHRLFYLHTHVSMQRKQSSRHHSSCTALNLWPAGRCGVTYWLFRRWSSGTERGDSWSSGGRAVRWTRHSQWPPWNTAKDSRWANA